MAAAGVNMALTIPYVSRLNDLQYIAGRRDDPTKTIRDGLITLKAGNPVFNLYTAKAATRDFGLYHLGATHAVVVFRGTDLGNGVPQILRDALHDAQLFFNSVPTRTEAARLFITQNWAHWTNGRTLVFVGHSLGGRIAAELTAHFPNSSAHIFNPAYPIHDGRPPAPHLQRVVAYCIKGDWVWQSFNGPHRFVIPVTQKDKHALSNFIR
ncbi:hypothetical protein DFJ74DRAFT_346574 [Hyaloraphidium curvatum]|nr:hypothetical protein DFJ74DRAFT_346574 [Hyaloraphidium curvatum]